MIKTIDASELPRRPYEPEPSELAYRRGYSDGFIQALNAFDRPGILTDGSKIDQLHQKLFDFWGAELQQWLNLAYQETEPPVVIAPDPSV